jgi:hypothetical protein
VVEPRCPDERDDAPARLGDKLDGLTCRAYEPGPEQEVLRRVARRCQLGEDDEVSAGGLGAPEVAQDPLAVSVELADDRVQLCESDSQGFRLTVTNLL